MAVTIKGSGQVPVQIQTVVKTDTFSVSGSVSDVTGLSVSITPTSSSNKILIFLNSGLGATAGAFAYVYLFRGSTQIATSSGSIPTIAGTNFASTSVLVPVSLNLLDSPATTSSITYKVQLGNAGSGTAYVNRRGDDTVVTCSSILTVMEIAYA